MKTNEVSELALEALLRTPLEVPDAGFSASVRHRLASQAAKSSLRSRNSLWPAGLFASAVALALMPWEAGGERLLAMSQRLQASLAHLSTQSATGLSSALQGLQDYALWLPVGLALMLLVLLLPLAED